MKTDGIGKFNLELDNREMVWTGRETDTVTVRLEGANLDKVEVDWSELLPAANRAADAASGRWDAFLVEEAGGILTGRFPGKLHGHLYVDVAHGGSNPLKCGIKGVRAGISVNWTVEYLDERGSCTFMQDCTLDLGATYADDGTIREGEIWYQEGGPEGLNGAVYFTVDGNSVMVTEVDVRQGDRLQEWIKRKQR